MKTVLIQYNEEILQKLVEHNNFEMIVWLVNVCYTYKNI